MSQTIERSFVTRRDADIAIEHLVQEHGVARTDIFVVSQGEEGSAGVEIGGGDAPCPGEQARNDAPLKAPILVSIDVQDAHTAQQLEAALDTLMPN